MTTEIAMWLGGIAAILVGSLTMIIFNLMKKRLDNVEVKSEENERRIKAAAENYATKHDEMVKRLFDRIEAMKAELDRKNELLTRDIIQNQLTLLTKVGDLEVTVVRSDGLYISRQEFNQRIGESAK